MYKSHSVISNIKFEVTFLAKKVTSNFSNKIEKKSHNLKDYTIFFVPYKAMVLRETILWFNSAGVLLKCFSKEEDSALQVGFVNGVGNTHLVLSISLFAVET